MEPTNYTAKEFFVIKESCPVRNTTKRIKLILDGENTKNELKINSYVFELFKEHP